ncbi:hypothetical protein GRX01_05095 [Halobaculum sp. WSA2]|uniref:Restriction endonuclease type IV Mrr domain-containing protein n=1 Tax=Halobaculum saliterrae TaxID=2073113 RepID=A0A6B0SP71_9EURY|nr:restriction endonuclease [Halobaculum saliterrae]MXR40718.1 hypothetical protein [Halobaculum saliterrae]
MLDQCVEGPPTDPDWYRSVLGQLAERTTCDLASDEFDSALADDSPGAIRLGRAMRYATVTAAAVVLVDATLQYPSLDSTTLTRAINDAARNGLDPETVTNAGHRALEVATAIGHGEAVVRLADAFPHPDDTRAAFASVVTEHLSDGSFETVQQFRESLTDARTREWTRGDLLAFPPIAFEELVADCWREYQNAVITTRGSSDRGIDVIARTDTGTRLAIQAKRYQRSNTVGIATVQRTAGLTVEFDIDRAVVVTSSNYTRQATESAEQIGLLTLVDGEQLCAWLTASSLAPPFMAESA